VLQNPDNYFCAIFADTGAARLAVALLGHPRYATEAMRALGWLSTD
jgi:hypothetical protein